MARRLLLIACSAAALVAGLMTACAQKDDDAPPPPATPAYQAGLRSMQATVGGAAATTFAVGETVRVELTLTNITGTVRTESSEVLTWYLDVYRADGTLVRADHRMGLVTGTITIQPGLPYTSQRDWPQVDAGNLPVVPGEYVLTAVSTAGSTSVPITIVPAPAPAARN